MTYFSKMNAKLYVGMKFFVVDISFLHSEWKNAILMMNLADVVKPKKLNFDS